MEMKRIYVLKRGGVTRDWRRLHNEEFHNLYTSSNIIRPIRSRRMRGAGHVECMGEVRNAYKILVRKVEGKKPLVRPRRRWEYNIRMDLRETEGGRCGLDSYGSG
jgi:hypothetical protein